MIFLDSNGPLFELDAKFVRALNCVLSPNGL